jgi:D-alanine--poly(phosphoribitol) ligase subunit 2
MDEKIINILVDLCDDEVVKKNRSIDLFETGLLDSLTFVEVLVRLEEECGCSIAPSEVEREEINTPQKIIDFVKTRSGY